MSRDTDDVLAMLATGPMSGRVLRERLNEGRWFLGRYGGPGFYAMMARMEDAGLVSGYDVEEVIDGVVIHQRWYRGKT